MDESPHGSSKTVACGERKGSQLKTTDLHQCKGKTEILPVGPVWGFVQIGLTLKYSNVFKLNALNAKENRADGDAKI